MKEEGKKEKRMWAWQLTSGEKANYSIARLAQSVERQALNLVVGGSSPPVGDLFLFISFSFFFHIIYFCMKSVYPPILCIVRVGSTKFKTIVWTRITKSSLRTVFLLFL